MVANWNEQQMEEAAALGKPVDENERVFEARAVYHRPDGGVSPVKIEFDDGEKRAWLTVQLDQYAVVQTLIHNHPQQWDSNNAKELECYAKQAWGENLRDWFIYLMTREVASSQVLQDVINQRVWAILEGYGIKPRNDEA